MSEELKLNENVGAPQPDALAQIASVDPSPAVGGMHPFTPLRPCSAVSRSSVSC